MRQKFTPLFVSILLVTLAYCGPTPETKDLQLKAKQIIGALPEKMPGSENDTAELVSLGKKLYFEKKLSVNETQSCNSCHNVEGKGAGVDNLPTSPGAFGKNGDRNSPTVLNAGFHFVQFWDGRAADLKAQAKGPILNPVEMAMPSEKEVLKRLNEDEEYPSLFAKAYPNEKTPVTYENLAGAIAAFERTLVTFSRFDDFINGDYKAISQAEQEGFKSFMAAGCTSCHSGNLLGGNSFRKMGQVNEYKTNDLGLYNVTKKAEDKYFFKVPSLRNIALTGPYFHDGQVKTLEEAVKKMAYHQLGMNLSEDETKKIVTFLGTLSDKNRTN
ncbi:cytochrome-c peroxidase [Leptospira sp. 2 VSF19]|uniref:Cytochrome-c peroxidase n=1 Tax=Leptospira soteropolitanensis TaxID=2950025 RepID=A0AAW5VRI5_9LEPT|nr:cytochrome-c peroxidase [Leptospira soteropolitanensis]MCW7493646.1 cytochrome-c peroxidase [Leptospira soteropolitanensis]MCW7501244.1 cytochrome-c peroxidase [Leptospira soteropolitanensis]MCW7523570.1 cytochrome-c peroxidase [Leptospira soteropolitanensis]MCW7527358.1 cytochrome-c peroxidase [Leptospira soteropolitanensis]MCW7531214.1 cytochrome-c peroxidase [Leptospira soteropolitanensis]